MLHFKLLFELFLMSVEREVLFLGMRIKPNNKKNFITFKMCEIKTYAVAIFIGLNGWILAIA